MKNNSEKKRPRKRKDFEIRFYEGILKQRPACASVLIPLGDAYTRKGFYSEGLIVDKKLVQLHPDDPFVRYNLACSLSLLERPKEAMEELKKAVLFGYDDFSHLKRDPDLENVRKLPEFKVFIDKLKRLKNQ